MPLSMCDKTSLFKELDATEGAYVHPIYLPFNRPTEENFEFSCFKKKILYKHCMSIDYILLYRTLLVLLSVSLPS